MFDKTEKIILLIMLNVILAAAWMNRPNAQAQIEKHDPDFIRTVKSVEVREYDQLGVKSKTWTDSVVVLRHQPTGTCWLGTTSGNAVTFIPAPAGVCK